MELKKTFLKIGIFIHSFCIQCYKCFCCCLVAHLCPPLCYPVDCSLLGSSVHEIIQARMTGVGCHFLLQGIFPTHRSKPCFLLGRWPLYPGATREALQMLHKIIQFYLFYPVGELLVCHESFGTRFSFSIACPYFFPCSIFVISILMTEKQ